MTDSIKTTPQVATPKPFVLRVCPDGIPTALKNRPQWVLWRLVLKNDKWTKVPFQCNGRPASSIDANTWASFENVWAAYERGGFDGVGITIADGLVFIDLDNCCDPKTSLLKPWSSELRAQFKGDAPDPAKIIAVLGTYTELSPSGTGFHLFASGRLPSGRCKLGGKGHGCPDGVEMYQGARYATVTGRWIEGCPANVADCNGALTRLHAAVFGADETIQAPAATVPAATAPAPSESTPAATPAPAPAAPPAPSVFKTDAELIEAAKLASNGEKFQRLWNGDTTGYSSASEADLALANLLAFYAGPDPARIEALMRQSGLLRAKWNEHKTYMADTVATALEGRVEFYGQSAPGADALGAWALVIVDADPPLFKLASPFYDGHLTLTGKQYLNFAQVRDAAINQKKVWLPGGLSKAWHGSKDGPALGGRILAEATHEEAPDELHRGRDVLDAIRDWAAGCCKGSNRPREYVTPSGLPARDDEGNLFFMFRQLKTSLNASASPEDRVTPQELSEALKTLGAEDVTLGRDREKRTVKKLSPQSIAGGVVFRAPGCI